MTVGRSLPPRASRRTAVGCGTRRQTAARLYCHRNTVLNRLRRVEGLTDRSLERVDHLVEWALALLALDVLPPDPARPTAPTR